MWIQLVTYGYPLQRGQGMNCHINYTYLLPPARGWSDKALFENVNLITFDCQVAWFNESLQTKHRKGHPLSKVSIKPPYVLFCRGLGHQFSDQLHNRFAWVNYADKYAFTIHWKILIEKISTTLVWPDLCFA